MDKLEELKKEKLILNYRDIMYLLSCGESKARGIIRSIKAYNNTLNISGKITIKDFENWYYQIFKPTTQNESSEAAKW